MTATPTPRARTPQNERIEATQRKILESAKRVLRDKGFKSATLRAIAQGADVSIGALQHHFEGREVLFARLVDEAMAPLSEDGGVWPDRRLPLRERAEIFVDQAWRQIFGASTYLTAWSLFFGCKAIPSIFSRIDARRAIDDKKFFSSFSATFPELQVHHPYPNGFVASVFSALRGIGVSDLFDVSSTKRREELHALADTIVRACIPSAGATPSTRRKPRQRRKGISSKDDAQRPTTTAPR
jgi:AcrR family transcriptional regulator